MKKIMIPKCRNPFVVIMNGIRYEYESGKEVEVPDEVAAIIQFHVDSKPKALPIIGGGGYCDRPHVYFSDAADKLPTDAVDGSLAVVSEESATLGTWVFDDSLTSLSHGTYLFEFFIEDEYGQSNYSGIGRQSGGGGAYDQLIYTSPQGSPTAYDYINGVWTADRYKTITITSEPTDEVIIAWIKENATRTKAGKLSTLYSRENGEWVSKGEVDFTDLASS